MSKKPFIVSAAIVLILLPAIALAEIHNITVGDSFFSPNDLTIKVGDTVRWTNAAGGMPHDVTADDFSFASATASSFTFSREFTSEGVVLYFCTVHSSAGQDRNTNMNGRITVEAGPANTPPTQPGTLSASVVTTSSATVQWGASTDAESNSISYKVEYRHNGQTTWSNGGVTSNTSQSLSGLDAGQAYDVQVTPNDGTADGPSRTAQNLFQTEPLGEIFPINAGLNGNWWNGSDRSGEGIQVEISGGNGSNLTLVASFYSYDTAGNQIFMIMVGPVSGDTAEVDIYITTGGLWGDNFDPLLVVETQWGTGTIRAFSCGSMEMDLRPNDAYKAEGYTDMLMYNLERLPGIVPVAPCPIANP